VVGGADVSFRPTPGRQLNANRSSLIRTLPGSSRTGRGVEEIRAGQRWFGHAPVGAGTSTKAPNVGIHSVDGGVTDRSDCWMDGDFAPAIGNTKHYGVSKGADL